MPADAGLVWGQQDVMMTGFNDAGYWIEASADGTNWGNPEAVVTAVRSRLQDGSLAEVTSQDNREAPIQLRVRGEHYDGLVAGEEALVAETRREGYNTLSYLPPVEDAATTVFDVVYSVLDYALNDLNEARLERQYTATMTCLPFPRAAEETVAEAVGPPPVSPSNSTVDNGSSTTGWGASYRSADGTVSTLTPTSSSGSIVVTPASAINSGFVTMTRTGSVTTTSKKYIIVDWFSERAEILVQMNDGALTMITRGPAPTAGYSRAVFQVPAGTSSLASLTVVFDVFGISGFPLTVRVDQIISTDTPPSSTGRYQLLRSVPVAGSVRTQGRLAIEHATAGLGEVLVYAFAGASAGYSPALRQFRVSGGATPSSDVAAITGVTESLGNGPIVFEESALGMPPGNYRLMGRVGPGSFGPAPFAIDITATTLVAGVEVGPAAASTAILDLASGLHIYDLAGFILPTNRLANAAGGKVRITVSEGFVPGSGPGAIIDELWLFNIDIGTLTFVSCGTGTGAAGGPSNRLWLDPATVTNTGQPAVFVGHAADRSDAFNPGDNLKAWTPPVFEPDSMNVFTVTTGVENALVTLRHYRRGLHHIRAVA